MNIDLQAREITPLRHTYAHVAKYSGEGKPASRYQEATYGAQPMVNFHYRPTWDPQHEIFAASGGGQRQVGREGHFVHVAAAPRRLAPAHQIHDHRAHHLRGPAPEMYFVFEPQIAGLHEAQIRLVHDERGVDGGGADVPPKPRMRFAG